MPEQGESVLVEPVQRPVELFDFAGETFAVGERIGLMALMRFAIVARNGVDTADLGALAAIHDLLEQCIADDDWQRFNRHADKTRAGADELLEVVKDVFRVLQERPTTRPSDSSDGPPRTVESSTGDSFSRVIRRLEDQGRPDLAVIVTQAQTAAA